MLSTPSLESYDKLKTEFNTYRTQAEDNQRELNKTIKHLKIGRASCRERV